MNERDLALTAAFLGFKPNMPLTGLLGTLEKSRLGDSGNQMSVLSTLTTVAYKEHCYDWRRAEKIQVWNGGQPDLSLLSEDVACGNQRSPCILLASEAEPESQKN